MTTQLILIFLGLFILLDVIFVIKFLQFRKKISSQDYSFIKKKWAKIEYLIIEDPTKAIMNADKLLGHILKLKGYEGTVGEQLKASGALFNNLNSVWDAHKVRNALAHDFRDISDKELKSTLKKYKNAFKDLGVKL